MPPRQFEAALVDVSGTYKDRKDALSRRAQEVRARRETKSVLASAGTEVDASVVDTITKTVAEAYDPDHGGFGTQPKFPMASAVELLLCQYQLTGDAGYRSMVEKTLDNMMSGGLYDNEQGGFFRYSTTRDWSVPHYEKMLEDNLNLLRLYLRGHLIMGNDQYAGVASRTVDYLNGTLYDQESSAFYGSQNADEEYYALPLADRKRLRRPGVDPVLYANLNAAACSAYLEAAWVLNRPELGDQALKTLDLLLDGCQGQPLRHSYYSDGEVGIPALLVDYAYLVLALVDAYDQTRDSGRQKRYLDEAQRLAGEMIDSFWDKRGSGFLDIQEDPRAIGNLRVRDKPLGDNVPAIEAMTRLYNATVKQEYREAAAAGLSAFVPVYQGYGEAAAGYAVAVHRFLHSPVEVTIVGKPGNPDTKALVHAAATIPYPHTAIKFIDGGDKERLGEAGYWPADEAQAYVCLDTVCLAPINDPQALHQAVTEFLESRTGASAGIIQVVGNDR